MFYFILQLTLPYSSEIANKAITNRNEKENVIVL